MSKPFKFKEFIVHQDRCAMKIGTDGVLLGTWASIEHNPNAILDIGAGTGLLSLMLAQRSNAENIEGIEIDEQAFEQCMENFETSIWADRLFCYHAGLDEFVDEVEDEYDLIVSNPPFYAENFSSGNIARDTARQNIALPFDELLHAVDTLLAADGIFTTIIPFKEEETFIALAKTVKLYPNRILRVRGHKDADVKRSLLEFSRMDSEILLDELIIELKRHVYTKKYINLTKDFYLKM